MRRAGAVLVTLALLSLLFVGPSAQALAIKEYPTVTPAAGPFAIALGSDGNLWFTEEAADAIGRITPSGTVTEFPIPTAGSGPRGIAPGSDGNLWFTEFNANKIGRITTSGTITEFTIPTANSAPWGIAPGPDTRLWFAESGADKIGRITTSGTFSKFALPTPDAGPLDITSASDGNMWFTEAGVDQIGRITTAGTVTEFTGPTIGSTPFEIASGSDGALWFTEENAGQIGRISTSGAVTEYTIPTPSLVRGIAPGWDNQLWFTETASSVSNVASIDTTGSTVIEYPTPTSGAGPEDITSGPDGVIWFTEFGASQIGTIGQSQPHILNVYYIPNFFVFKVAPLGQQGDEVNWLMLDPGTHGIADSSGMHLFGFGPTGGPDVVRIGQTFSFSFKWAGKFSYNDPFHASSRGTVKVPISVRPAVGAPGAQVVWASGDAPSGFVFDVQVKQPGSSSFMNWKTGATGLSGLFSSSDPLWVGAGKYSFRARLRQVSSGAASGYSAAKSIALT